MATVESLTEQLRSLGVAEGVVLLVHTSFRAVRPVEGGPRGLIQALCDAIGPSGTLVMPSWPGSSRTLFDPLKSEAATNLGVVAQTFWRMPGVLRTTHTQAFAAMGPRAADILRDPLPLPPHIPASPVGRVHDLDGQVLLLGVNHDADTTIHLAEVMAGVPYGIPKSCLTSEGGEIVRVEYLENDHCCERFRLVDVWLDQAGVQRKGRVGSADARLARAQDITGVVVPRLEAEPLTFLHDPQVGCGECDGARMSVGAQ